MKVQQQCLYKQKERSGRQSQGFFHLCSFTLQCTVFNQTNPHHFFLFDAYGKYIFCQVLLFTGILLYV